MEKELSLRKLLSQDSIKNRFNEIMGERANAFITSILNTVTQTKELQKVEPNSVVMAAAVAATLDLPINKDLGFAWIIPYGGKAQFQIGYKGLIQLCLRTGQYDKINVIQVCEGQLKSFDPLTEEVEFDFSTQSSKVIGYVAYFKLVNGFSKTVYWDIDKIEKHAKKFSKSYKKTSGIWFDEFDAMAKKTVLKNTLSKWGIMSIDMQTALKTDQAIIKDLETDEYEYIDNEKAKLIDDRRSVSDIGNPEEKPEEQKGETLFQLPDNKDE